MTRSTSVYINKHFIKVLTDVGTIESRSKYILKLIHKYMPIFDEILAGIDFDDEEWEMASTSISSSVVEFKGFKDYVAKTTMFKSRSEFLRFCLIFEMLLEKGDIERLLKERNIYNEIITVNDKENVLDIVYAQAGTPLIREGSIKRTNGILYKATKIDGIMKWKPDLEDVGAK